MKNPDWFKPKSTHKAIRIGPADLYIPLCKIAYRDYWPKDGCYDVNDVIKFKWKDVECPVCVAVKSQKADLHVVAEHLGIKLRRHK